MLPGAVPPGATPPAAATTTSRRSWWRRADSPSKLRLATAVTVLAAIGLSLGGWYSIDRRDTAIDDAADAAAQLIDVQDVRVQVVQADSLASTAYLVGGQESAERRAAYDASIADAAAGLLVAAQRATETDAPELQRAGALLTRYTGLVEQARANNRQGFPVGAAYQRQAREVASELVASLRVVEERTRRRVDDSMERGHRASWLLVLTAFVVVGVVLAGSWWLARRWRRLVNVPLAAAAVVAVGVLTIGVAVNAAAVRRAGDAVRGPLSAADLVAQARAASFDARSSEALTLINRGNGAAYEQQWQLSASVVDTALGRSCDDFGVACDLVPLADAYRESHEEVRRLDDGGEWDAAVEFALTGRPATDFDALAAASADVLDERAAAAQGEFDRADRSLPLLRLLVVLAGAAIAALAAVGYGQRLREYR